MSMNNESVDAHQVSNCSAIVWCWSFCPFSFDHCVVYPSSIYRLWYH